MVHKLQVGEPLQKQHTIINTFIQLFFNAKIIFFLLLDSCWGLNKDACFYFNVLHQTVIYRQIVKR